MKYSISKTDDLQDRLWSRLGSRLWNRLYDRLGNRLWDQLNYRSHHQLINLLMNKLKRYEV